MGKATELKFKYLLALTALAAALCVTAAACTTSTVIENSEPVLSYRNSEAYELELSGGDLKPGTWGGIGIGMIIEKNSATVEFDCADATISSRIKTAKDGTFNVMGIMTRLRPGPLREDKPPVEQRVRFDGKVTDKQMNLTVKVDATGEVIGNYSLEYGKSGRIRRCL